MIKEMVRFLANDAVAREALCSSLAALGYPVKQWREAKEGGYGYCYWVIVYERGAIKPEDDLCATR